MTLRLVSTGHKTAKKTLFIVVSVFREKGSQLAFEERSLVSFSFAVYPNLMTLGEGRYKDWQVNSQPLFLHSVLFGATSTMLPIRPQIGHHSPALVSPQMGIRRQYACWAWTMASDSKVLILIPTQLKFSADFLTLFCGKTKYKNRKCLLSKNEDVSMVYLCYVESKQTTRFLEECPLYRWDQSVIANCRLDGGIMI